MKSPAWDDRLFANPNGEFEMRTQAIHPHSAVWLLILVAAVLVGFFILTAKPAAQPPVPEAKAQSETVKHAQPGSHPVDDTRG
jgi:hypothetical protein